MDGKNTEKPMELNKNSVLKKREMVGTREVEDKL